jgi:hypothetical protein
MPDEVLSRLSSIRIKIRRLTKSPSEAQLTDADIDSYINSFILYDMPTSVSLNSLKTVLRFYTEPYVDSYATDTNDTDSPLYHFKDNYTLASNTVYISGNLTYWTASRSDFYTQYPRSVTSQSIGTGDDVETNFTGTLDSYPLLPNSIIFASQDLGDNYIKVYDDGAGNIIGDGNGDIDYITGVYDVTFDTAPGDGYDVYSQSASHKVSMPTTMLFYENTFHLRPVPDKAYAIEVEVFKRPTELLLDADLPDLYQWWEYIAFGSARKILIDKSDFEGAALLEIEMEKKEEQVLNKTVIENTIREGYGI